MRIFGGAAPLAVLLTILSSAASAKDTQAAEMVPGEFLVKIKKSSDFQLLNQRSLEIQFNAEVKRIHAENRIVVIQKPTIELASSIIDQLSENPIVELVEPNYIYRAIRTPNDPDLGKLWGLKNTGQSDTQVNGVAGVDIDAERAWDITTGSENVIVAVIDTGLDYTHPDLKQNAWINEAEAAGVSGVDDDKNGYVDDVHGFNFTDAANPSADPMDDQGHGTHCSGTIGAKGNDGAGIVGVAWNVRIMGIKFLGADGSGTLEGAIKAIDYATKMKARIMSNSWGGGGESQLLKEAIERAHQAGALFIAAAGNDGMNNDSSPHFPSNYQVPNVLSVAAIDNMGRLASFSNYGKRTVHVAAPGVNIYSSLSGGTYDSWSGTSMATPHVSGIAALLVAHEPNLSNVDLKNRITSTAKALSGVRGKVSSGGIANAFTALTNQLSPPDMNDPSQWQFKSLNISTKHPYDPTSKQEFEVEVKGAKEIALYFEKFQSERGYDKLTLIDRSGKVVGVISGIADESYTEVIAGDYVKGLFTSDDSIQSYGFDLTKVSFR